MRVPLVLFLACLVGSCGGGQPVPPASRAAATVAPRFADTDPHDWVGVMPWHYAVHGIDVSKYQGDIDWPRVRASGVAFAFIKATEGGDHADERFADNWAAARAAGMPRGAYHYYYFCRPALEQAAWFMNHVPEGPRGAAAGARPRVDPQVEDLHLPPRPRHRPRRGASSCRR